MSSPPIIMLGDQVLLFRTLSLPQAQTETSIPGDNDYETVPRPDDPASLHDILYDFGKAHADDNVKDFWPYAHLCKVMTPERVLHALVEDCGYDQAEALRYCALIRPPGDDSGTEMITAHSVRWCTAGGPGSFLPESYIRIFALLVWQKKGRMIKQFIDRGVSDRVLPLERVQRQRRAREPLPEPWNQFDYHEMEQIHTIQWKFLPPFFAPSATGEVAHYDLPITAILPWVEMKSASKDTSTWEPTHGEGGFAIVKRVKIDSDSHCLGRLLGSTSIPDRFYAVKSLRKSDMGDFSKEVEMLKRFGSNAHAHLVTLLATFTYDGRYHFIFPWAECDLDQWWSRSEGPPRNTLGFKQWIAKQLSGLADALYAIHEPRKMAVPDDAKKFGRHGDLKPENVLWFASKDDPMGILVISDFGISAVHSDISKSNVPNQKLPHTPTYRPPECDIEGGKIAQAFDIWTMGCIFVEMVAWLVGGANKRAAFKQERWGPYLAVRDTDIYFDIQEKARTDGRAGGSGRFVFLVKEAVIKYMEKLHANEVCTGYMHDLLKLVHNEMLVVMSPTQQRIRARPLSQKLLEMHQRALRNGQTYAVEPAPWPRFRIDRALAVEAPLIEGARKMLSAAQQGQSTRCVTRFSSSGVTEMMTKAQLETAQGED